jgi:hypothetical protein
MKKIYALLIIMIILFTACQPTPEELIVQSKEGDLVQQVVNANSEENAEELHEDKEIIQEQIEAINEYLNMEFQPSERVKVIVDANVQLPVFEKIPMVRVVPENLTKEHMETLIKEVCEGQTVYYEPEGRSMWSKQELDEMILSYMQMAKNPDLSENTIGYINDRIDFFNEIYGSSVQKGEEKIYDGVLTETTNNRYYSHITSLKCYLDKNCAARINLCQSYNKTSNQLTFRNHDDGVPYNGSIPYDGTDAPNIDMTYEEAKNIAENLVSVLDGENTNMKLQSSAITYIDGGFTTKTYETSSHAYVFSFARQYNGLKVKTVGYLSGGPENIRYGEQVLPEVLTISMDDDGIIFFGWQRHTKYKETLTEDVPLLDFDTVQKTFEEYMGFKFAWEPAFDNVPKDATSTITIHTVELNLMMTLEKDNLDNYIMIPVWDFVGDQEYNDEIITQEGEPLRGQKNVAILTINAIDGTVIDREQGY